VCAYICFESVGVGGDDVVVQFDVAAVAGDAHVAQAEAADTCRENWFRHNCPSFEAAARAKLLRLLVSNED